MDYIRIVLGGIAGGLLVLFGSFFFHGGASFGVAANVTTATNPWVFNSTVTITGATTFTGASTFASTVAISGLTTLNAGLLKTSVNSTSTTATAQTAVVADFKSYDTLILIPNVGSLTYTLFASSTAVSSGSTPFVPTAGNEQTTCIINGTTTAAVNITMAGGTGTTLLVASSSATALGSLVIGPQKKACLTFTRANATATTFDILTSMVSFK